MDNAFYFIDSKNTIIGSIVGLIVFWIIGEIFYVSQINKMLFWDIGSRIFALLLVAASSIVIILVANYLNKNRQKKINNLECYSIDI